jgi:hypothetical protein
MEFKYSFSGINRVICMKKIMKKIPEYTSIYNEHTFIINYYIKF